jgi:hypothetical protein
MEKQIEIIFESSKLLKETPKSFMYPSEVYQSHARVEDMSKNEISKILI